jgi:predicted permease
MRRLRGWILRLAGLFNKSRKDRELDEEIESHVQLHTEDNLRWGITPEQARREAMIKLGGIESIKEAYREQRGLPRLETLWQDIRYGARMLRKYPCSTAAVVLTLALGIGANTALFTAVDTIMFRPLAARDPDRLVLVAKDHDEFSFPFYERLRASLTSLEGLSASQFRAPRRTFIVSSSKSEPQEITTQGVTGNFFSVLGVAPLYGRTFTQDDDTKGAAQPIVVISYAFWRQHFGADPTIVGVSARLDNVPVTIVGVMPPDFVGFEADVKPDLWWPLQLISQFEVGTGRSPMGEGVSWLVLFGRLRKGILREQAQAEASAFFRRQLEDQIAENPNRPTAERERILSQKLELLPGRAGFVGARGEFSQPLTILMGAVGIVLLIACANIAGLLLARGLVRRREFALRAALGAGRGRIAGQILTEGFLLAGLGGASGFILARLGTKFLAIFIEQSNTPVSLVPDVRALFFAIAASLVTGVVFSFAPAWRSSRLDLTTAIKNQGNTMTSDSSARLQPLLVIAQVALSVLLLAGAGLFVHTLRNLRTVGFGFKGDQLLCLEVDPGRSRRDAVQMELVLRRLLTELETVPGVRGVSLGGGGLLTGNGINMDVAVEGYTPARDEEMRTAVVLAGARFFETLHVPLLNGRDFTPADEEISRKSGHATVAILGEGMARHFFGSDNPVGKHLTVDDAQKAHLEIIGVAKDTRYSPNLRAPIPLEFYIPFFGSGIRMPPTFYLRTDQPSAALAGSIRQVLVRVGPELKIRNLRSMDKVIDLLLLRERIIAQLVSFFSGFALLLTCLGLYGILSFRVDQRIREIGVRMALGAQRSDVLGLFIGKGLKLALVGNAIGLIGGLALTRLVSSLLYGVNHADPVTWLGVSLVLGLIASLASWLPARRATKVDPMVALRCE